MTLVEVLAGLVVLGTLLSAILIARGRFLRQWADADRQLIAAQAVDAMLEHWMTDPGSNVPLKGSGALPGAVGFEWSTQVLNDKASADLGAMTIRLSVFDRRQAAGAMFADQCNRPVMSVDFLVQRKPPAQLPVPGVNSGTRLPARP